MAVPLLQLRLSFNWFSTGGGEFISKLFRDWFEFQHLANNSVAVAFLNCMGDGL